MFDTAAARRMMVDGQVRTADVTNPDLIDAMLAVPRELFVPPAVAGQAYLDSDIAVANGRALLKPMVLAKLIQAAQVVGADHVLDVGCATGYSSAVLARLAGSVVALEEDAALAHQAEETLAAFGAAHVVVATGPLTQGWPAAAPYDLILLNGATEIVPDPLGRQLKPNGRMAGIFGRGPDGKGDHLPHGRGPLGRPADFRCRSAASAGLCRAAGFCFLASPHWRLFRASATSFPPVAISFSHRPRPVAHMCQLPKFLHFVPRCGVSPRFPPA